MRPKNFGTFEKQAPGVELFESVLIKSKFRDGYRGLYWVVSHDPYFLGHSAKDLGLNFSAIFFHYCLTYHEDHSFSKLL